jgi:uncharacterized membrane protein YphA (DoxX/SURF4 family)
MEITWGSARVVVGLVFIAAAVGKGARPAGAEVLVSQLLGARVLAREISWTLILCELVLGLLLVAGLVVEIGLSLAIVSLTAFTCVVWKSRASIQSCSCFGELIPGRFSAREFLLRNLSLVALSAGALLNVIIEPTQVAGPWAEELLTGASVAAALGVVLVVSRALTQSTSSM